MLVSIIVLLVAFIGVNWYKHKTTPIPVQVANDPTLSEFIFTQDYKVEQANYNGGDWPSGAKVTKFKRGDVVEGKYGIDGCEGVNCVPPKIVMIIVNGQNIAVDTSILIPYVNQSNIKN